MNRVLIVEDEPRIASFLEKGLNADGFTTSIATDGTEGLEKALSGEFDLIVLDLGLPRLDGLDVLREIRRWDKNVTVIVLTARSGVGDTVGALDAGADDYITKPFSFEELLARIRVRQRIDPALEVTVLSHGDATLDLRTRRLTVAGVTEDLTAREFTLTEMFFRHPGQVLSRTQLLSHVWGYDYEPDSNIVDVYIGYLRKKLGKQAIATVRGIGYRLDLT